MDDLLDYAEELTRAELRSLPNGTWEFEDFLDDDGFQEEPIRIHVALTKEDGELVADFRGTSPQVKGSINMPYSFTCSATYACVRSVIDPGIPNNEGFFRPIRVVTEPGSFVDWHPPRTRWRRAGSARLRATRLPVGRPRADVAGQGVRVRRPGRLRGDHRRVSPDGRAFVNLEFLYSGWGGRPDKDGIDGISLACGELLQHPGGGRRGGAAPSHRALRLPSPIRGGAGKFRGSLGIVRDYRLVGAEEAVLQVRGDRQKFQPFGAARGKPGRVRPQRDEPDGESPSYPPGEVHDQHGPGRGLPGRARGRRGLGRPVRARSRNGAGRRPRREGLGHRGPRAVRSPHRRRGDGRGRGGHARASAPGRGTRRGTRRRNRLEASIHVRTGRRR